MRKTDKKIDKAIISALTEVCEEAKFEHPGFSWLTHEVDYQRFPSSLRVTLVFDEQTNDEQLKASFVAMIPAVQQALEPIIGETLAPKNIEARREHQLH